MIETSSGVLAPWLPGGFLEWMPWAQAILLGLLTFVQEDIPTVGASLLASSGSLSLSAAFLGCFFGIWIGDALLYLFARGVGPSLLKIRMVSRFVRPDAIARSERWFEEKGVWFLLASRFVPGARLPTYLAAGFLGWPFPRFLCVTGFAVAIWTLGIFGLARVFGPALVESLRGWRHGGWVFLGVVVAFSCALRLLLRFSQTAAWQGMKGTVEKWRHWEFWPPSVFYLPVAVYYLWMALRYGGLRLPTQANPGIFSGGLVGESKWETLRALQECSPEFTATTWPIRSRNVQERLAELRTLCSNHSLSYPFILKPDVGQRGVGVKLIRSEEQAAAVLAQTEGLILLQRYAPGPCEVGVFYYRFPDESRGRIFAITEKIFPSVMGDGRRTVEELIRADARARLIAKVYLARLSSRRGEVLPAGESLRLVEAGNHAQGCIFLDGAGLWSESLERRIDEISQGVPGFFIGRYDIRYASEQDLMSGKSFQILELNGAASEATSIYDARNSLSTAYRTLFRQWKLVFAIGAANRRLGAMPTPAAPLWRRWRDTVAQIATYPLAD